MADTAVSKAAARKGVRVRIPPRACAVAAPCSARSAGSASNARRMARTHRLHPHPLRAQPGRLRPRRLPAHRPVVLWTVAGAIMGGPVAVNLFGFVGWLVMVAAGTVACTAYAAGRAHRHDPSSVINRTRRHATTSPASSRSPTRCSPRCGRTASATASRSSTTSPAGCSRCWPRRTRRGARGRGRHRDRRLDAAPRARRRARDLVRGRPGAPRGGHASTSPATAAPTRSTCACRTPPRGSPSSSPAASTSPSSTAPRPATAPTSTRSSRLLRPGGLLLVDNVLMGGGAATGEPTNQWSAGERRPDPRRSTRASRRAHDLRVDLPPRRRRRRAGGAAVSSDAALIDHVNNLKLQYLVELSKLGDSCADLETEVERWLHEHDVVFKGATIPFVLMPHFVSPGQVRRVKHAVTALCRVLDRFCDAYPTDARAARRAPAPRHRGLS